MNDPEPSPFAAWLKEQTAARDLSICETARRAGLSKSTVSVIMRGQRPRARTCRSLAQGLGLPAEQVLRAAGHMAPAGEGVEIPADVRDLVEELRTVSPEVRRTVMEAWRAALELARAS